MDVFDTTNEYLVAKGFRLTGQCHRDKNEPCEDIVFKFETDSLFIYGIADGQSGKKFCRQGGMGVLNCIAEYIIDKGISALLRYQYRDEIQYEIMRKVRKTLSTLAEHARTDFVEFSSTVVLIAIDPMTREYMIIHLGDGGVIGIKKDNTLSMLSSPENGITLDYTWLTTSSEALPHLRINGGFLEHYKRILLFSDGASAICKGTNINWRNKVIICQKSHNEIANLLHGSSPRDDASCILIDFRKYGI